MVSYREMNDVQREEYAKRSIIEHQEAEKRRRQWEAEHGRIIVVPTVSPRCSLAISGGGMRRAMIVGSILR